MITFKRLTNIIIIITIILSCKDNSTNPPVILKEEKILFIKNSRIKSEICTIKPDGTDIELIASHVREGEFIRQGYHQAKWSPNGKTIAVHGGPGNSLEYMPIWLMDNNGALLYRITTNGHTPFWSDDGNKIYFNRRRGYFNLVTDFYIYDLINFKEELFFQTPDSVDWNYSNWDEENKTLLVSEMEYWLDGNGTLHESDQEIVTFNIQSREKILLTDNNMMDYCPKWSPDKSEIIYIYGRYTKGYTINIMDKYGGNKRTLIDSINGYQTLIWSPSGDEFAFAKHKKLDGYCNYQHGSDLFIYNMKTSQIRKLTNVALDSISVLVCDWK